MIFTSGKKRKQTTHHLSFGGDTLGKVTQYKYLGVLFTCNLKFDTHVNELVLPKVRRVAGYVRHLLAKFQTGRCTFLRILWLSKIQSIINLRVTAIYLFRLKQQIQYRRKRKIFIGFKENKNMNRSNLKSTYLLFA